MATEVTVEEGENWGRDRMGSDSFVGRRRRELQRRTVISGTSTSMASRIRKMFSCASGR
jgi:hypothetical protein